ncbi:MAG: extracellular solute-binding protein [Actinobacteria bacterium]|nr:extracellular solute-binding protein [Actinomycetota bacterium]
MIRRFLPAFAAVAIISSLSACDGGRDALTIYSGRDEALIGPLLEQFAEDNDIAIDVRYGETADLALLIAEEGDDTPADVFLSQSPGAVGFLANEGLLGELSTEELSAVDARFESDDGRWIGLSARQRVLVYNEELVDEADLPDSVLDLTGETYAGDVALAPTNGSFQDFVTAMRQTEGEDVTARWLGDMQANGSPTYADNSSIVDAVARGEVPMGLVNHYYNYRKLEEDPGAPSRNYAFPDGDVGSLLIASTASIVAGTDKQDDATAFIDYLLSDDAQQFYSDETFEYPLTEGVEPSAELPPLDSLETPDIDLNDLGNLQETASLIEKSGLL